MKVPVIRLMFMPVMPIASSVIQHYAPDWISPLAWYFSCIFSIIAFFATFLPWESFNDHN